MSKEMSVIVLGVLVMLIPYLGIPGSWRTLLLVVVGVAVTILGFLLRGETISQGTRKTEHLPFVDSAGNPLGKSDEL
jgi:hypothetical protein